MRQPQEVGSWQGRHTGRIYGAGRTAVAVAFGVQAAAGNAWSIALGLPSALKWLDECALVLACGLAVMRLFKGERLARWKLWAAWPLAAFSLLVVVSGIANRAPFLEMLLGWRLLAQFLVWYVLLVWLEVDRQDLVMFFAGFFAAAMIHVPLSLSQWFSGPGGFAGIDKVTGGFGAGTANLMGYWCGVVTLVSVCLALVGRQRRYLLITAVVATMWPLTSANGSYMALAIVAIWACVVSRELRRPANLVVLFAVVVLQFTAVNYVDRTAYRETVVGMLSRAVGALSKAKIDGFGNPGRFALARTTVGLLSGSELRAEGALKLTDVRPMPSGGAGVPIGTETDPNWKTVAVADFNRDGQPDLVWRNSATGQNRIWLMTRGSHTGDMTLPTIADGNWKIVGAGDVNEDGHPDLAWRNSTTRQDVIWFLKNGVYDDWLSPATMGSSRKKIEKATGGARTILLGLGPGSVATPLGGRRPSNFERFAARTHATTVFASVIGYLAETGVLGLAVVMGIWLYFAWLVWSTCVHSSPSAPRAWLVAAALVVPYAVIAGCGEVTWSFQPVMYPVTALAAFAHVYRATHRTSTIGAAAGMGNERASG